MRYVLDTSIFSALMSGAEMVEDRLRQLRSADVLIPQPVVAEISAGIERLPRSRRERDLRRDLGRLLALFPRSPWTDEVSHAYARTRARLEARGTVIEDFDLAIAAHALVEGAVLVTDNVRHFDRVPGLTVENWRRSH